jgi:hypothetical protein
MEKVSQEVFYLAQGDFPTMIAVVSYHHVSKDNNGNSRGHTWKSCSSSDPHYNN